MAGFETHALMVSKWWMARQPLRKLINRKFTRESDRPILSQIFDELSSRQSLPIYRGLSLRSTGRVPMFFLLRLVFWLGLVLVLLPRDKTPDSEKMPQISVSDAVQAATAAVSDMSQFCKRQPAACEVGGQAATVIGVRAQDGARKIYNSITDKKAPEAEKDKKAPD